MVNRVNRSEAIDAMISHRILRFYLIYIKVKISSAGRRDFGSAALKSSTLR